MAVTFADLSKRNTRAFILCNKHGGDKKTNLTIIKNLLKACSIDCDIGEFESGQGHKMAREAVESGKYGLILPYGGDGTVNKAASSIATANSQSVLAPISGGTFNHFSGLLYANTDSHKPWLNVLRMMEAAVIPIDIGKVEASQIVLASDSSTVDVESSHKTTAYFLLSCNSGVEACVLKYVPKRLKYYADKVYSGLGIMVIYLTAVLHLFKYKVFPVTMKSCSNQSSWTGQARSTMVAKANYAWQKSVDPIYLNDGMLTAGSIKKYWSYLKGRLDSVAFKTDSLEITQPASVLLEADGSLVSIVKKLEHKFGSLKTITYRFSLAKINVLVPSSLPQPYIENFSATSTTAKMTNNSAMRPLTCDLTKVNCLGLATLGDGTSIVLVYNAKLKEYQVVKMDAQTKITGEIEGLQEGSSFCFAGDKTDWGYLANNVVI